MSICFVKFALMTLLQNVGLDARFVMLLYKGTKNFPFQKAKGILYLCCYAKVLFFRVMNLERSMNC